MNLNLQWQWGNFELSSPSHLIVESLEALYVISQDLVRLLYNVGQNPLLNYLDTANGAIISNVSY